METQTKQILAYMKRKGSITSWDAFQDLKITRLSGRIKDMRDEGYEIETVMEESKEGRRYGRYYLIKEPSAEAR